MARNTVNILPPEAANALKLARAAKMAASGGPSLPANLATDSVAKHSRIGAPPKDPEPMLPQAAPKVHPDTEVPGSPTGTDRRADTARARMNAPISIIVDGPDGKRIGKGMATLRDLSLSGAFITQLHLRDNPTFSPDVGYTLKFRLMAGPLAGMEADCHAVRYDAAEGGFGCRIPDGFRLPLV
jgi:hypothetical protein